MAGTEVEIIFDDDDAQGEWEILPTRPLRRPRRSAVRDFFAFVFALLGLLCFVAGAYLIYFGFTRGRDMKEVLTSALFVNSFAIPPLFIASKLANQRRRY